METQASLNPKKDVLLPNRGYEFQFIMPLFRSATGLDILLVCFSILCHFATGIAMPAFLFVFGNLINSANRPSGDGKSFEYYITLQVYIGLIAFVTTFAGTTTIEIAAERQIRRTRHKFVTAIMRQDMAWADTFDLGTLASQLNQSCVTMRDGCGTKFGQLFMFLGMVIGGYTVGFIRGAKLTLVVSALLPLLSAAGYFFMRALSASETRSRNTYSQAGAVAEEAFGNIRTIVAFGTEDRFLARYEDFLKKSLKEALRSGLFFGATLGLTYAILFLSYALGLWYGGTLIAGDLESGCVGNCYSAGDVLAVFFSIVMAAMALGQCGTPLTALVKKIKTKSGDLCLFLAVVNFIQAVVSARELWELINRQPHIDTFEPGGLRDLSIKGELTFKNVRFRYPSRPDTTVFESLSLTIPAGKTVALVGTSGSGKSTIVQLIERFYDPDEGEVLLDGVNVKQYNLKWLRDQIGLVNQEPRLFARTIRENILNGKLDATEAEINNAVVNANAANFVSNLPNGLETFAGEGGAQLSGGQKQRIAIARAILRDPAILLLDEATSALDAESEKVVQETLDRLVAQRKRTTVIIAHRLSTVRKADVIIVLKNLGQNMGAVVVESGSHEALMKIPNGAYKRLVEAQELGTQVLRIASSKRHQFGSFQKNASLPVDIPQRTSVPSPPHLSEKSPSMTLELAQHDFSSVSKIPSLPSNAPHNAETYPPLLPITSMGSGRRRASLDSRLIRSRTSMQSESAVASEKNITYDKGSYLRMLGELHPYYVRVITGSIAAAVGGFAFPMLAIALAETIQAYTGINPKEMRTTVLKWALVVVGIALGIALATFIETWSMEGCGQLVITSLRKRTFEQIIYQEIAFFDAPENSTGALSELLSSDILLIKGWIGDNLGIIIRNVTSLLVAVIIAFLASAKLAAVSLAAFLTLVPAGALNVRFMKGNRQQLETSAEAGGFIINETLANLRIVNAYNLQNPTIVMYDAILKKDYKTGRWNAFVGGFFFGLSQFLQFGAQALVLWYGFKLVKEGQITSISRMLQAIFALIMGAMNLGQSLTFVTDMKKAQNASYRIYGVLNRRSKIDARSSHGATLSAESLHGNIQFNEIVFHYPTRPEVTVHHGTSFTIGPGETVALVGSSGCGKSTIVQLLERFYDLERRSEVETTVDVALPINEKKTTRTGGSICLDSTDIRDINVKSLRSIMALVSQEPVLFNTTIRDNIEMGSPGATDSQVVEAAKLANAHSFIIEFPEAYNTFVGAYGSQLSGGQKQRIALARAMLRNPRILLLDEATSALDTESEKVVQEALNQLLEQKDKKRTTILIAHRLSTVKNADKIVVFANADQLGATVVEIGNHSSLMQLPDGVYRRLVQIASAENEAGLSH